MSVVRIVVFPSYRRRRSRRLHSPRRHFRLTVVTVKTTVWELVLSILWLRRWKNLEADAYFLMRIF